MTRQTRRLRNLAAALAIAAACAAFSAANAAAGHRGRRSVSNSGAPVPYMGVDTWYAFWRNIDQQVVVRFTNSVVRSGLEAAGYRIVWLDAGWWQGARDEDGRIEISRTQWPNGMRWLVSYIHSKGLLAGIYTDAGTVGCQNAGSYGHYQNDVDTIARWGFDAVKVDFCGGQTLRLSQRRAFGAFARAIRYDRPHRKMLFAICNGALPGDPIDHDPSWSESAYASYRFARKIATSWRTGPDLGVPNHVEFEQVLWNIALDARHPRAAGGGHWNDPDYLAPDQGMDSREARAQFTMWSILAAPLMLSANLGQMSTATLRMYENPGVIRIDQDPLGIQGRVVAHDGGLSIWAKPLWVGAVAVALLNRGARSVSAGFAPGGVGLSSAKKLTVENVWRHTRRRAYGWIRVRVPEHGAVLLRLARG